MVIYDQSQIVLFIRESLMTAGVDRPKGLV
jgi:hypothetical protein